ncbi:hypothetical protein SMICM304S_11046 [Streptomyces microflavus]
MACSTSARVSQYASPAALDASRGLTTTGRPSPSAASPPSCAPLTTRVRGTGTPAPSRRRWVAALSMQFRAARSVMPWSSSSSSRNRPASGTRRSTPVTTAWIGCWAWTPATWRETEAQSPKSTSKG